MSDNVPDGAHAPIVVTATVTNTGPIAGAEGIQVYLGVPADGQPRKRRLGFRTVPVQPGESQPVVITIDWAANNHPLGVWNYAERRFMASPGDDTVYVGNAADSPPRRGTFNSTCHDMRARLLPTVNR